MLYLTSEEDFSWQWHTGEKIYSPNCKIKMIQADGNELNFILKTIKGIPYTFQTVQIWVGEFANQIFAILELEVNK